MMGKYLNIQCTLQIDRSASEVFEAIVDPAKMANYFISKSTGRMESGKSIIWYFPEFDEACEVKILDVQPDLLISFNWLNEGKETLVEIRLVDVEGKATIVKVEEGDMMQNEKGIQWLKQNTEGWANFLACLKAYLEFGINLRKGGFDFHKQS
jgi:uncharacterized protein YndB with AHSA1/START domain